ncbi:MAG: YdjY domain-containing protein, partial [Planctomycetota bacterium]
MLRSLAFFSFGDSNRRVQLSSATTLRGGGLRNALDSLVLGAIVASALLSGCVKPAESQPRPQGEEVAPVARTERSSSDVDVSAKNDADPNLAPTNLDVDPADVSPAKKSFGETAKVDLNPSTESETSPSTPSEASPKTTSSEKPAVSSETFDGPDGALVAIASPKADPVADANPGQDSPLRPSAPVQRPKERRPPPAPPKVDTAKKEVTVRCRFVNPTRQLEVFACHTRGPTHETVVEFDTTGQQLYEALLNIGCRPTDFWNATSASDFLRIQGDRVLVLLRWTSRGKTHELPAEAVLLDGETGRSSFIRGFSFSAFDVVASAKAELEARKREAEERGITLSAEELKPKTLTVPLRTEISLGATKRERAVYSVLSHPTSLRGAPGAEGAPPTRALQYWSFPPLVDDKVLPDLSQLVSKQTSATLVFRRVASEVEIVEYARSIAASRGLSSRAALYDALLPVAGKIDALKTEFLSIRNEIHSILKEDTSKFFGDSARELQTRAEMLRLRGQWLCSEIQTLYFTMYFTQEQTKLQEIAAAKNAAEVVKARARTMIEDGLAFEVAIAKKEAERDGNSLRSLKISQELWSYELQRETRLFAAKVRELDGRIRDVDADDDYLHDLLDEDRKRAQTAQQVLGWRMRLNTGLIEEIAAYLRGEAPSPKLAKSRAASFQGLKVAKIADELLSTSESIRWFRNDLESNVPDRQRNAASKIKEFT